MTSDKLFISYSSVDGLDFAIRLVNALEAGPPSYPVWFDRRDIPPGYEWDEEIPQLLRRCAGLLFVMTDDSVGRGSHCKLEWVTAMKYKKEVIPLQFDPDVEMPFRLGSRQAIDFADFTAGFARLRQHLAWSRSQEGVLSRLQIRLADASRELSRTNERRRPIIEREMTNLRQEIDRQLLTMSQKADTLGNLGRTASPEQVRTASEYDEVLPIASSDTRHDDPAMAVSTKYGFDVTEIDLQSMGLANRVGMGPAQLGAELVAGSIVLDASICDYAGVDLCGVVVDEMGPLENIVSHPGYILDAKQAILAPRPNRPKVHLVEWQAPILDQGDIVTLKIARSDYWISEATRLSVPRIQAEVLDRRIELLHLPRRLDVHLVVVTDVDKMLHLTRRGSHVTTERSTWMITVGESMDWEQDKDALGTPQPYLAARRCLSERDELNLPTAVAESADLRLIAIATEWSEMLVNAIVLATIPALTGADLHRYFRRGENVQIDAIKFDLRSCVDLLKSEHFGGNRGLPAARISDISRVSLLAALRSEFPLGDITALI